MKEALRIAKLFEDLYNGSPWIDVTIVPSLKNLSAQQANERLYPDWNTIWEITNHMISWREAVLQRVQGKILASPSNNFIQIVKNTSEDAWKETLTRLESSQQAWLQFLKTFKTKEFETIYPPNGLNYYEHLHGILQHDAYHLGQIVIMAKQVMKK